MEITVEIKTVYGNESIYPICNIAKGLARLAGTKTLTKNAIEIIKSIGYKVNVKAGATSL